MEKQINREKIVTLAIGFEDDLLRKIESVLPSDQNRMTTMKYDLDELLEPVSPEPAMIFCADSDGDVSLAEVAQTLRAQYQKSTIFLVSTNIVGQDQKVLVKNGFDAVFFLPNDEVVLKRAIADITLRYVPNQNVFVGVQLADLDGETTLEFDTHIFLPLNNRYIKYSRAGRPIGAERVERIKNHEIKLVLVAQQDMPKFYNYSANRLRELDSATYISETERSERMHRAVRDLFCGVLADQNLSFNEGRKVMEQCKGVVDAYILAGKSSDIYQKIVSATSGSSDSYSHASNVSTFAALLAIGLGEKNADVIAMAGLLHDIGLAKIPYVIQGKDPEKWSEEERLKYEAHPEHSLDLIRSRKLIVPELVLRIIEQHHEKFNGTGFPKGLAGRKICSEAQILFLADWLDELLITKPGRPRLSLPEAIAVIKNAIADSPHAPPVDPDLFGRVADLILPRV